MDWGQWRGGGYLTKRWRPLALEPLPEDRSEGSSLTEKHAGAGGLGPRRGALVVDGVPIPGPAGPSEDGRGSPAPVRTQYPRGCERRGSQAGRAARRPARGLSGVHGGDPAFRAPSAPAPSPPSAPPPRRPPPRRPPPRRPPQPLTIVMGAAGPGRAPARSDPRREGATGAAGWLRRWAGRRGAWRVWAERRTHPPALQTRRETPLCPSETHAQRLTSETGNRKPGRTTSQKVGGTSRACSRCLRVHLTEVPPPFKDTGSF